MIIVRILIAESKYWQKISVPVWPLMAEDTKNDYADAVDAKPSRTDRLSIFGK